MSLRYSRCVELVVAWLTPLRLKLYPATIFVMFLLFWIVSQYLGPGLTDLSGTIIGSDFLAFYNAGKFYLNNQLNLLYDFNAQFEFQRSVVYPVKYEMFPPYMNPPFATAFYSLFATRTYKVDLIIWYIFGFSLLCLSIYLLRREIENLKRFSLGRLLLYSLQFFPTLVWFSYGQNSSISLFLFTIFFIMLRKKYDLFAGFALGLIIYKPQLVIALFFMLLIKMRWKALIGFSLGCCLWIIIGFKTYPLALKEYIRIMPVLPEIIRLKPGYYFIDYSTWGVNSLFGFSSLLLDNFSKTGANVLFLILDFSALLFLAYLWLSTKWEPNTKIWDMRIAVTIAIGLLISPHLFLYDLMILLLPLAIIWNYYIDGTNNRALDGGSLLFWSFLLYIILFLGNYISALQLKLCALIGLPKFAIQFTTIIIAGWITVIFLKTKDKQISERIF